MEETENEKITIPSKLKNRVNILQLEGLFLLGGLIASLATIFFAKKTNFLPVDQNLFSGLGLALVFSVINLRAWRLFAGLLINLRSNQESPPNKAVIFLILSLKLSLILLVVPFLLLLGDGLVVPFLIGFSGYLLVGLFLIQIHSLVHKPELKS
jgi:hypothetical protein